MLTFYFKMLRHSARESLGQFDTYSSTYLETKDTNDTFDSNIGITQPRYYFGSYQIQV